MFAGFHPNYTVGDQLSSVTGILNYAFDNYRVTVTESVTLVNDVTLARETTIYHGDNNYLSLATYNLENLDLSDNKYDILASDIVYRLQAPDILALQEVQDADGAGTGTNLSGASNAQGLIDAIFTLTGPALRLYRDRADRREFNRRRTQRQHPQRLSLQCRPRDPTSRTVPS